MAQESDNRGDLDRTTGGLAVMSGHLVRADSDQIGEIRAQFPELARKVRDGQPLVYLDSAATTLRPLALVQAMEDFAFHHNAAVHRGAHQLAEEATEAFENARATVARFLNADPGEVVWTSGATGGLNLIAHAIGELSSYAKLQRLKQGEIAGQARNDGVGQARNDGVGEARNDGQRNSKLALAPGDEIVVSVAEHHSNLVPWQQLAARTGAVLKWFDVTDEGRIDLSSLDELITERTKIVALTHVSNVTGAITPVAPIVVRAKQVGAVTVLDACQSAAHLPLDVRQLGVDFLVFSGHKVFGPTGVGVLYGRREILAQLPPVNFGGSMVKKVTMTTATFLDPPMRFEAGTQMVTEAIGLAAALDWLSSAVEQGAQRPTVETQNSVIELVETTSYEADLTRELLKIQEIPGITIVGPTDLKDRTALVSFTVDGVHPHDVGQVLDDAGVAVRVGQHCAQPIHARFGMHSTVRASASIYNTVAEIEKFRAALATVRPFFGVA